VNVLPLSLLRVRTRKGEIRPIYATVDQENREFARTLVRLFEAHVGQRKGSLLEKVAAHEAGGRDYRLVRGLALILQRQCSFQVEAPVDPVAARRLVFEAASRQDVTTAEAREHVLQSTADQLHITPAQLEASLYADLDEELVMTQFRPLSDVELLKRYNLALTQTVLFRATFLEVRVTDHGQEILRDVKLLGLMYAAESRDSGFTITVDGPVSLFKLTQRYGTRMAKLLPTILQASAWEITSSIIRTSEVGKRIHQLRLTSLQVGDAVTPEHLQAEEQPVAFDSQVEATFYADFQALGSDWTLTREPTPLMAGRHVFLPDFCFEHRGMKVYLEIVGFWTRQYLENKVKKVQQLRGVDLVIAANQKLVCDKLRQAPGDIIYYTRTVPATEILKLLQRREDALLEREVQSLDLRPLRLEGDVVELQTIAEQHDVSVEALRARLKDLAVEGYTLVGGKYVRIGKLHEIGRKLESLRDPSLQAAVRLLEGEGVKEPLEILSTLNYGIRWHGLDLQSSSIYKKERPDTSSR
jgi:predicted nuclease of restriction endonuclease-like RecB superfamily